LAAGWWIDHVGLRRQRRRVCVRQQGVRDRVTGVGVGASGWRDDRQQTGAHRRLFEVAVAGADFAEQGRRAAAGQPGRCQDQQVNAGRRPFAVGHGRRAIAKAARADGGGHAGQVDGLADEVDDAAGRGHAESAGDVDPAVAGLRDRQTAGDAAAEEARELALSVLAQGLLAPEIFGREQSTVEEKGARRAARSDRLVERDYRFVRPSSAPGDQQPALEHGRGDQGCRLPRFEADDADIEPAAFEDDAAGVRQGLDDQHLAIAVRGGQFRAQGLVVAIDQHLIGSTEFPELVNRFQEVVGGREDMHLPTARLPGR
jgi:hypothetical protein